MVFYENEESIGIEQVNQHSDVSYDFSFISKDTEKSEIAEEVFALIKASAGNLLELQTSGMKSKISNYSKNCLLCQRFKENIPLE